METGNTHMSACVLIYAESLEMCGKLLYEEGGEYSCEVQLAAVYQDRADRQEGCYYGFSYVFLISSGYSR